MDVIDSMLSKGEEDAMTGGTSPMRSHHEQLMETFDEVGRLPGFPSVKALEWGTQCS